MDTTSLIARFRMEVRDEATPYLWSDGEVFSYLEDAQREFCRLTGGIADSTSKITSISVPAGTEMFAMDPSILKLRSVRRSSDGKFLELLNFEDIELGDASREFKLDSTTGQLKAIVLGMEPHKARCVPIPSEDTALKLIVYRMPLLPINAEDSDEQELEIDQQHHLSLLMWMKFLAHMKQDAETYDRGRANDFMAQFASYCDRAKGERERAEHKYRTIAYGGL